jgi:DNA polymerase I-like protein with 3'-5' exonuclease and polymerase domains/uracil-DNA glycosylase
LLVGEVPGETETKRGEPFAGKAGQELQAALAAIGIPRSAIALTNVIPCRPPGDATGALDRYLKDLDKRRKREREATKGAGKGPPELADPRDCCRPRLLRDLARCPNVIPVGGSAFHAVCGGTRGILDARGSPVSAPPREEAGVSVPALRILPTLHPSFVMRKRRWRGAFRADLARAFRWFSTGLDWRDPKGIYTPSPRELRQALEWFARQPFSVFDVETAQGFPEADHFDPLFDKLRCLGIGTAERFVVVPFRSRDPERAPFYYGNDRIEIVRLVREYLTSSRWKKVGWNSRSYDTAVLKAQLGIREIAAHLDAIGLHRLAEPELPHDLGYSGSIFTDVDDWKAGHTATEAKTDEELWLYNAKDLAVTAMTVEPLRKACAAQGQTKNVPFFAKIQDACAEMHRNGLYVNQARRQEWDSKLLALAGVQRKKIRELAGWPKLNPNSTPQIRELLFDRLKMLPYSYTESGDPSTEDDALRAFMSKGWGLDPKAREIVSAIRMYRRQAKRRGVVVKLRPITEGYYEAPDLTIFDESEEEKKERFKRIERGQSERACGLTLPDGRVHASFNAHGTCVDPATWIITDQGPRRIGDVPGWGGVNSNVEARGLTLHDGDTLRSVSRQVHVTAVPGRAVRTVLGFELTGAEGHRVQVAKTAKFRRNQEPIEPEVVWKRLDELTEADYVRVRIGMDCWASRPCSLLKISPSPARTNSTPIRLPQEVTEDLAFLAGVYNADGCFHDSNGSFGISVTCRVRVGRRPAIRAAMERLFGAEAVGEDKDGVRVTSISLKPWVEAVELRRWWASKRTPSWVFASPRPVVEAYLRGLSFDASVAKHGDTTRWRYVGNAALTEEVHVLLTNMGIVASRRCTSRKAGWFEVLATGDDAERICRVTGKPFEDERSRQAQTRPKFVRRGDTLWLRVKSNKEVPPQPFLDVTVPATSCFWANGTISHNTGWRIACNKPNVLNIENRLRDMFTVEPGNILVACDEAQLELRMVAALARCAYYLDRFADPKIDPHHDLCVDTFGEPYLKADKDGKKKLRRSVKELTYSCAARGTRVVTLGPEGAKPIEDLQPGEDWTWTWDGEKYAPTQITAKWSRGVNLCVKVTFEWRSDTEMKRDEAIFTGDHRFILRDGSDRSAADLLPGDSLMPFGRWRSGPYRMIDLFNDGGRHGEHRAVMGLLVGDPRHVHHLDENGQNNDPLNLVALSAHDHVAGHWDEERRALQREMNAGLWASGQNEKLAAGRRASPLWRAANAENYMKMRAGLEAARAMGKGTTKGQERSRLETLRDEIGVLPDAEIAKMAGVTRQAVYYYRKTRGIAPGKNHRVVSVEPAGIHEVWDIEVDHPAHNFALEAGVFVHNSLYGAGDETKWEIVTSAEDDKTETLLFPDFTLREVQAFSRNWHRRCPEIAVWWEATIAEWSKQGYLAEPVMGGRCQFLDGEDPNKMLNFKPQSGGAALAWHAYFRAAERLAKEVPSARFIHQGYDSLMFECKQEDGEKVKVILEETMIEDGSRYGLPIRFVGEAKQGPTWKDV